MEPLGSNFLSLDMLILCYYKVLVAGLDLRASRKDCAAQWSWFFQLRSHGHA